VADPVIPDENMIADLVFAATGHEPTQIERSGSGLTHDVYDVGFRNRPAVVLRVAGPGQGQDMIDAARLIRKLRSLGVPLAPIFADRSKAEIPHLLLMPLPGSDLGDVADRLSDASLAFIAGRVQAAQAVVAQLPTAGRFGYSAAPEAAPHTTWGAVIDEKLDRARARIGAAGVFDPALADGVAELARALRAALDGFPAIAFLPDATDKNVIVTEHGGFSGIVDVDNLCFGDPRFAAALTLAGMTAFGGPARYVEMWMRAAGWEDDAVFRFYIALFLLDFMGEQGEARNGNEPPSDAVARGRLAELLGAAVAAARTRM
jgi:aminoglycoside phosphotransferase (APT) family kinase protein